MSHAIFRRIAFSILALVPIIFLAAADTPSLPAPAVAKKVPHATEIHGHKMADNYAWLREKSNPEVRAYLEQENLFTDAVMKPTEPFQKKLYEEMLSRVKETDVEVPYREGDYFYYVRTEAGKQYPIRCRKKASMDAP
jgi:oligopeptidase B